MDLQADRGGQNRIGKRDTWDIDVSSRRPLLDLDLAARWRYRDLVAMFVRRDFVAFYKQTILGPLCYLIQPLPTSIAFTVVFTKIARIPTDGLPPLLFYLAGIVVWS